MIRWRVLIADDHVQMLARVRGVLAAEFDVVAAVTDGRAAVDLAASLCPDLVVLDISMPALNGLDAAAMMARLPRAPLIVFLSVYDDPDFVEAARRVGASGYVLKRRMAADLLPAVRLALRAPARVPAVAAEARNEPHISG